jgi:hypothetical protein
VDGRAICSSVGLSSLLHEGGKDLQVFHLEAEAMQWMNQPLGTRRGNAPPVSIRSTEAAGGAPNEGLPSDTLAAGTECSARGSVVVSAMGNDPSVGDPRHVYNKLVDSAAEMNRALDPDGMTNESRGGLYNNMIDITALPGRLKHRSTAIARRRRTLLCWRSYWARSRG